ncbi:MAG: hypothetical protein M8866_01775 [marine benthic group bacterium]|jgi:hypothetical protein|nr:hypothetical protein [Candidatus Benthicola marisminoris]
MEQDRTNGRNTPTTEVATRLRDLGQRIAPTEISDVWVFPPLSHLEGSTEFLLFTRFLPDEMRHLCGAEFAEGNGNGNGQVAASLGNGNGHANGNGDGETAVAGGNCRRITEYGAMPSHRVPRVVAGFRERLGDHREPLHFEIGGCTDSWVQLISAEEHPVD